MNQRKETALGHSRAHQWRDLFSKRGVEGKGLRTSDVTLRGGPTWGPLRNSPEVSGRRTLHYKGERLAKLTADMKAFLSVGPVSRPLWGSTLRKTRSFWRGRGRGQGGSKGGAPCPPHYRQLQPSRLSCGKE